MADNGAFALVEDLMIPFLYLANPLWKRENIYVVPEVREN